MSARALGDVPVTQRAGELTLGLVPRAVLDDHIDLAVNVARAHRIGHGVDRQFLAANPRASMQWKLERELDAFEAGVVADRGPVR